MIDIVDDPALGYVLVLLLAALSVVALARLGVPLRSYHDVLKERWVLGVPWGTLIVVSFLFAVYLFPQRGLWDWHRPIVVAYTAVSLFDPTGWLFAGFAHTSPGHLRGNVTSTLVFAPIVEWVWRHKPASDPDPRLPAWTGTPWVRAFVLFPLGIGVIGVIAALFSWGPVIGFSVAVYALIGIGLVHHPMLTIVAVVARQPLRVLWRTWTDPVVLRETTIRAVRPGWFGTAVQGHLVGLLIGVAIGIALLRWRGRSPSPARLWFASVILGFYLSLWALWWIMGPEQFVLLRAIGVALVFAVATVIVVSAVVPPPTVPGPDVDFRQAAVAILLIAILGMGAVSIGLNLATAEPPDLEPAATVGDYEIYYGEEVPDGMINIVEFEALGLTTDVRTSGVIVYSEQRNVWRQPVSEADLEARGSARFTVGGLGWGEQIRVEREGWTPTGAASVYMIRINDGDGWNHAFSSDLQVAQVRIADRHFGIATEDQRFLIGVEHDEDVEWEELPDRDENITMQGVELRRNGDRLIAAHDGTEVTIATLDTYR